MTYNKDRIIFFASGDFAIPTLERMIEEGFNICGIVTSAKDKVRFNTKTIRDIAFEKRIPFYLVNKSNDMKEESFIEWISSFNADYFCVISFKKLPNEILKLANKCAFNIHASVLPYLRGAAPINWAIRLGYEMTGLTAFELNDKIDQGDIIDRVLCHVNEDDNYATLFKKLSSLCNDFTISLFERKEIKGTDKQFDIGQHYLLDTAPKIDNDYFNKWSDKNLIDCYRLLKSVYPFDGLPIKICVYNNVNEKINEFKAKIYDFKVTITSSDVDITKLVFKNYKEIITDKKKYLTLKEDGGNTIDITELQLDGRKRLSIQEFLIGFKYFKKEGYNISIEFY